MKAQLKKDQKKALSVITSCKNLLQLQVAGNYITALELKYSKLPKRIRKENKDELLHLTNFIRCWRVQINKYLTVE